MAAIITDTFRKNNAQAFLDDVASVATNYYVGIGKSNAWASDEEDADYNVLPPLGTLADNRNVLANLTTLIGVGADISRVIPNIEAKVTNRHKAYDPFDPNCFYLTEEDGVETQPCYVIVNDKVYLCLKGPASFLAQYNLPTGSSTARVPNKLADGSVWMYIYTVEAGVAINTTQFVSVPNAPTLESGEVEDDITTASGDLTFGFRVTDGGSGYASAPVIKYINSDGNEYTLDVLMADGVVVGASFPDALSTVAWPKGKGYVTVDSGDAKLEAMHAPALGFGFTPTADLPSWYAGITVDADKDIFGDGAFIPYRQISIVRNAEAADGVVDGTQSLNCLQRLEFGASDPGSGATTGAILTQATSGAIGIVDYYDESNKYLYYHQDATTGAVPFTTGSEILIDGGSGATPDAVVDAEYVKDSGEVVFAENRKKISRTSGQTEEITLILQF